MKYPKSASLCKIISFLALLFLTTTAHADFRLEGESRAALSSGETGDDALVTPEEGEWIAFNNVSFTGASSVTVTAAHGLSAGAKMTVRIGSPSGTSLGTQTVANRRVENVPELHVFHFRNHWNSKALRPRWESRQTCNPADQGEWKYRI